MKLPQLHLPALLGTIAVLLGSAFADDIKVEGVNVNKGVPDANERFPANVLPPGFTADVVVEGQDPLENPSGLITRFGYLNDGPLVAGSLTAVPPNNFEATKTEPDENLYIILPLNPGGPTPGYDYGRHFLFQGHENANDLAYITRVNLDITDPAHRITLLTPPGADGKTHFNRIDGSTWNPFSQTMLFTQEDAVVGGVIEVTPGWPATATPLYGIIGQSAFEGIHPDDQGNLLLQEDNGGTSVNVDPADPASPKAARNPNSFVYRFIPNDKTHLAAGGKLQALQVSIGGSPVVFVPVDATHPTGDVFSANQLKLHTPGTSYPVQWVTVHDTAVDGFAPFNSATLAKAAGATPFKRPENGQFLPGADFRTFFFCPTGDTSTDSGRVPALAARGAWGSIFRVDLATSRNTGFISIVVLGDEVHSSFDNLTFADDSTLLATEDRGDTLHRQANRFDSVWAFDVSNPRKPGARFVALGRDPSSEIDAALLLVHPAGFQNEGDNEPTGLHVSDGSSTIAGLLGRKVPQPHGSRVFFTQQHGENTVFEIHADPKSGDDDDHRDDRH